MKAVREMNVYRQVLKEYLIKQAALRPVSTFVGGRVKTIKGMGINAGVGVSLGDASVTPFFSVSKKLTDDWQVSTGAGVGRRRRPRPFAAATRTLGKDKRWSVTAGGSTLRSGKVTPYLGVSRVFGKGNVKPVLGATITPRGIIPRVGLSRGSTPKPIIL